MIDIAGVVDSPPVQSTPPVPRWGLATRIAFRFCFLYFGLYILLTQMFPAMNPFGGIPMLTMQRPVSSSVMWVIKHVFHDDRQLAIGGGSGDKMFDWVFALCLLVLCAALTILWTAIDHRRPDYVRLQEWFRVWLRFGMATTLLSYGMSKLIPLQMPAPQLTRLLEPYGNFSPMGVLWYSIGASFPYERIVGGAEVLAAVLLFVPITVTLGGLVSLIDSIMIFSLNMTYDVPVKLFSFHLLLMSILILAPDIPRLLNVFVLNRPAPASTQSSLGRRRRVVQAGIAAQILLAVFYVWTAYAGSVRRWTSFGEGAPKPPFYGIWVIDKMTIDGIERAPLVTDYGRWRRVVIQAANSVSFWRMDDTQFQLPAQVDLRAKTMTITQPAAAGKTIGRFGLDQPAPDRLVFDGELNGQKLRLETHLFPREKFLLVSRGFNWIQELPFNR